MVLRNCPILSINNTVDGVQLLPNVFYFFSQFRPKKTAGEAVFWNKYSLSLGLFE